MNDRSTSFSDMKIFDRKKMLMMSIGTFVGSGVVSILGEAAGVTGYSVWIAYLMAILVGFCSALPYVILSSVMTFSGGVYTVACTFMGTSDMMVHFMVLLMVTGSLFSLISQYHMYWALDERVIPCGYAYPARRIRWCFYTPLIGAVAASFIQTLFYQNPAALVVQLVCQLAPLVLLWQYLRAVKNREDDPLHM